MEKICLGRGAPFGITSVAVLAVCPWDGGNDGTFSVHNHSLLAPIICFRSNLFHVHFVSVRTAALALLCEAQSL